MNEKQQVKSIIKSINIQRMYKLVKVGLDRKQEALQLLAQTIVNPKYGQPMSKILKTSKQTFKKVYQAQIQIGCSNQFSYGYEYEGKLISLVISLPYTTYISLPKSVYEQHPQIAAKKALHTKIHSEYKPPNPDKTLFMVWGTVLIDHFKHGMYEKLSLIVEDLAVKKGFEYSIGIASNISSQNISLNKLKYLPVYKVKYSDFKYNGDKVFQNIKGTQFIVVGIKKLIPQPNM